MIGSAASAIAVRDAGVVPQLEAAGVQVGGARHGRALGRGVDDPVLDALPLELAGEGQSDRSGAGHEHPDVHAASLTQRSTKVSESATRRATAGLTPIANTRNPGPLSLPLRT